MVAAVFTLLTGLSFFTLLVIGITSRKALTTLTGRLSGFAIVLVALGCFLISRGATGSLNSGQTLFIAGGAAFVLSAVLVAASLFIQARRAD